MSNVQPWQHGGKPAVLWPPEPSCSGALGSDSIYVDSFSFDIGQVDDKKPGLGRVFLRMLWCLRCKLVETLAAAEPRLDPTRPLAAPGPGQAGIVGVAVLDRDFATHTAAGTPGALGSDQVIER